MSDWDVSASNYSSSGPSYVTSQLMSEELLLYNVTVPTRNSLQTDMSSMRIYTVSEKSLQFCAVKNSTQKVCAAAALAHAAETTTPLNTAVAR